VPGTPPGAEELQAAGLYDPAAPDAAGRLALLEYLVGIGATVDDLVGAGPDGWIVLASRIGLWGQVPWITLDEVAEQIGLPRDLVVRTWRAAGFPEPDPDVRAFTVRDVEMLTMLRGGLEYFGEEVAIQLLRVLGAAAARVAEASVSAFLVNVAPHAQEADPSGLALARANNESIGLLDGLTSAFDTLLRHHLERNFRPFEEGSSTDVDLVRRSVGFVDLVASTAWTQELELRVLSGALTEFDSMCSEIVVTRHGRLVKLIGDEAMFVANDAAAACDIALALIEAFEHHDLLPPVRAGVATGDVLARDGDYSGAVVNLAARAVKFAAPSMLVADRTTCDALAAVPEFVVGAEHAHTLKGFAQRVKLSRIERAG